MQAATLGRYSSPRRGQTINTQCPADLPSPISDNVPNSVPIQLRTLFAKLVPMGDYGVGSWVCRCPVHAHDPLFPAPTLLIEWNDDALRCRCLEGCEVTAVNAAIGTTMGELPADWEPEHDNGMVYRVGKAKPLHMFSDMGNAFEFVTQHQRDLRYVKDWKQFVEFDGIRWVKDDPAKQLRAMERAKLTANELFKEANNRLQDALKELARLKDVAEKEGGGATIEEAIAVATAAVKACDRAVGHYRKLFDTKHLLSMLRLAQSDVRICVPVGGELFDQRPDLLNCPNGTVDLRTGELVVHRREDFITSLCPTTYSRKAKAGRYERFLKEIFPHSAEVEEYVRALSGYCLTGLVKDQAAYFFAGEGSNGKSLLIEIWPHVMGPDYCYTVPAMALMKGSGERHPTELVGFRGARLAVVSETEEDSPLNEARFKMLTGGDTMTARGMNQNFFEFKPTHKLVIATNHLPRILGTSHGMWRRPRVIEFHRKFWKEQDKLAEPEKEYRPEDIADPDLSESLKGEAEGILANMVRQAAKFFTKSFRFNPPALVMAATEAYRQEENRAEQFLKAKTRKISTMNTNRWMKASELYDLLKRWYIENGYPEKELIGSRKLGICAKKLYKSKKRSCMWYQCEESHDTQEDTDNNDAKSWEDKHASGRKERVISQNDPEAHRTIESSSRNYVNESEGNGASRRRFSSDYTTGGAR